MAQPSAHRPEDVRNLVLLGAGGAGKTSLLEALLALTKVISRRGSIPEKNTFSDFDPDEKERGHSLFTTVAHVPWEGKRIQILDTPGSIDFLGEPAMAMAAVETALLCVNAHDGVTTAARKLARLALAQGLPVAVILTRIEGENIDAEKVYAQLIELFGPRAVPINLPDRFGPAG